MGPMRPIGLIGCGGAVRAAGKTVIQSLRARHIFEHEHQDDAPFLSAPQILRTPDARN